jgi:hypothetical protein
VWASEGAEVLDIGDIVGVCEASYKVQAISLEFEQSVQVYLACGRQRYSVSRHVS